VGEKGDLFDAEIFWWQHEELHRQILRDFQHRHDLVRKEFDMLEQKWMTEAPKVGREERSALTERAFSLERETTDALIAMLETENIRKKPRMTYRRFWEKQNRLVGLKLK
jgi:hypothetical protein